MKKSILILGATGQVGKEISLVLKNQTVINTIFHARTRASALFLINNNINTLVCDFTSDKLKKIINTVDLVVDLTLRDSGSLMESKKFYKSRIDYLSKFMKKNSKIILASTMDVLGLNKENNKLKNYFFSRTIYASNKRFAEKIYKKITRKKSIDLFILRLSSVQGELQTSSKNTKQEILEGGTFYIPKTPAWIVFPYTISEAILGILQGKAKPDTYMLTNDTIYWVDLLEYFSKNIKEKAKFDFVTEKNERSIHKILIFLSNLITKDLIRANIPLPNFFESLFSYVKRDRNKIKINQKKIINSKIYKFNLYQGVLPGKRLDFVTKDKKIIFDHQDLIIKDIIH